MVGSLTVQRALPRRGRRTVGSWCFADVMGPADAAAVGIGPHPHIGLQTVTWLLAGELLHLDSLGSEQPIRPGQLNLMTAGHGVAHAEESPGSRPLHGIQLWIAQPEATRHDEPAFEHHADLPGTELPGCEVTVLVGDLAGARSPARCDTEHVGAELRLQRVGRHPGGGAVRARRPRGRRRPVRRRRAGARRSPRVRRRRVERRSSSRPASRPWCCCSAASRSRTSW